MTQGRGESDSSGRTHSRPRGTAECSPDDSDVQVGQPIKGWHRSLSRAPAGPEGLIAGRFQDRIAPSSCRPPWTVFREAELKPFQPFWAMAMASRPMASPTMTASAQRPLSAGRGADAPSSSSATAEQRDLRKRGSGTFSARQDTIKAPGRPSYPKCPGRIKARPADVVQKPVGGVCLRPVPYPCDVEHQVAAAPVRPGDEYMLQRPWPILDLTLDFLFPAGQKFISPGPFLRRRPL